MLIVVNVIYPQEEADDGVAGDNGDASDDEYKGVSGEAYASKSVTAELKKEVQESKQDVKSNYPSPYMFKPPYFITQVFKQNNEVQEKLFNLHVTFGHGKSKGAR